MATLSLNLNPETLIKLTDFAKQMGRSRSYYANEAITAYLKKIVEAEDESDLKLAQKISDKIKSGEMKTHSLEDVCAEFGL